MRRPTALAVAFALLVVGATLAGVAAPAVATTPDSAEPTPPHRFFGNVTYQDGSAASGVVVEVYYDGKRLASATTDSTGYYDLKIQDPDNTTNEETLRFVVKSVEKTHEWKAAESTQLDFTITRESEEPSGDGGIVVSDQTTTTTTATTTTTTTTATTTTTSEPTTTTTATTTTTTTTDGTTTATTVTTTTTTTTGAGVQRVGAIRFAPWLGGLLVLGLLALLLWFYRRREQEGEEPPQL